MMNNVNFSIDGLNITLRSFLGVPGNRELIPQTDWPALAKQEIGCRQMALIQQLRNDELQGHRGGHNQFGRVGCQYLTVPKNTKPAVLAGFVRSQD